MFRPRKIYVLFVAAALVCYFSLDFLRRFWTIASLSIAWRRDSDGFVLSEAHDNFDVTFSNYTRDQVSASPYDDLVSPILHHIALGRPDWAQTWGEAVQSCVDLHPGWESHIWTEERAARLVADRFPQLKSTWDGYQFPIERVDALRYMVLYEFGGVVLDMDLKCRRALGPLRRFQFVAPEARPTGFSIGFMMAEKHNAFVGSILENLPRYDMRWFWMPYATVMFSTGCHFASVIHANYPRREMLKILPGPLHSLSGHVLTPLFEHLGSSSWHSYDAKLIKRIDHRGLFLAGYCLGVLAIIVKLMRDRRRAVNRKWMLGADKEVL